jgi:D-glycero-alpha-D-manno-heptose 1-phosphate guanylyltransferase
MVVTEAIILAGGLGTRLRDVTGGAPKVLAPVGGRPFLEYILDYLMLNNVKRVILATGYGSSLLTGHFGDGYKNLSLLWSDENEPLGTGGAIAQAILLAESENVFILNGDTFFDVPLQSMVNHCGEDFNSLCLALKPMMDFDRYGAVEVSDGIISKFIEKSRVSNGLINGGVYLLSKDWLLSRAETKKFSFEKEILERYVGEGEISAYICDNYFIDIGIPADWERAQTEVPDLFIK